MVLRFVTADFSVCILSWKKLSISFVEVSKYLSAFSKVLLNFFIFALFFSSPCMFVLNVENENGRQSLERMKKRSQVKNGNKSRFAAVYVVFLLLLCCVVLFLFFIIIIVYN